MFIFVILGYSIVGAIEIIPLIKQKKKKELSLYCVLFATAFVLSLLLSLGIDIPSPAKPIEKIVEAIIKKK